MKMHGQKLRGPATEIIAIPRPSSIDADGKEKINDLIFVAKAVLDYSDFDSLCPPPKAPLVRRPGGQSSEDVEDPKYKTAIEVWNTRRNHWLFLESIKETPGLEWETVDRSNPETWDKYPNELQEAGLNNIEQLTLMNKVLLLNSIDEKKMDEARARFLASQGKAFESS